MIITNDGDSFPCKWAGVATIDGILRFEVEMPSLLDAVLTFGDSSKTAVIVYQMDETFSERFEGYTELVSVSKNGANFVIALKEE